MVEFCAQRRDGLLVPLSASDEAEMMRLPPRRIISVTATTRTPKKVERWFHAAVSLLVEATGRWPTAAHAKREILIRTGFFDDIIIGADGTSRFTPQSTAGWGIEDWRTFLDRAVPFIIENYAGETRAEFRNRVDAFLGIKLKEAWE